MILEPMENKLGPDTWFYTKTCLLALAYGKRFASKYFGHLTISEGDMEASMAQENISSSLYHL